MRRGNFRVHGDADGIYAQGQYVIRALALFVRVFPILTVLNKNEMGTDTIKL